jgi:indolepyruvate ferredoxin oxidoreductase
MPQDGRLSRAVAHVAAKLMTYKDEYEVARLMTDPAFARRLAENFSGEFQIRYNLAPPLWSRRDAHGRPRKRRFGGVMTQGFRLLRRLRGLRGTPLDPFGYASHRRMERQLIAEYETLVEDVLRHLTEAKLPQAEALLRAHDRVRGYDVVKEASVKRLRQDLPAQLAAYRSAGS